MLPDHLHCIWTLPGGDENYSLRWKLIKSHVSRDCKEHFIHSSDASLSNIKRRESVIWQRRFWEHRIRDDYDFETHMNYVHYNPVKHGLCKAPMDWDFSTLRRWVDRGAYPVDWGVDLAPELPEGVEFG
jgi:putative transposase